MSILEKKAIRAYSRALAGLIDFGRLFRYDELGSRIKDLPWRHEESGQTLFAPCPALGGIICGDCSVLNVAKRQPP